MRLRVWKFGGTSLGTPTRMHEVARLICQSSDSNKFVIVCSAIARVTNLLTSLADDPSDHKNALSDVKKIHHEFLEDLLIRNPKIHSELKIEIAGVFEELDNLVSGIRLVKECSWSSRNVLQSFGEKLSVRLMAGYINCLIHAKNASSDVGEAFDRQWHEASAVDADSQIGILTSKRGRNDCVMVEESIRNIWDWISNRVPVSTIPVVTGFISRDNVTNKITTLGRGGSDFTASLVAAGIKADDLVIWTDVNGFMTADPRHSPAAVTIPELTLQEALELAHSGAKIIHPNTLTPALNLNINISVRNTLKPEEPGSIIKVDTASMNSSRPAWTGVLSKGPVSLIDIEDSRMSGTHSVILDLFQILHKFKLSLDIIATSEISVSVTLDILLTKIETQNILNDLKAVFSRVNIETVGIITLVEGGARNDGNNDDLDRDRNRDRDRDRDRDHDNGNQHNKKSRLMEKVTSIFLKEKIQLYMLSSAFQKNSISCVVNAKDVVRAVYLLDQQKNVYSC